MWTTAAQDAATVRAALKAKGWTSRDVSVKADTFSGGSAIRSRRGGPRPGSGRPTVYTRKTRRTLSISDDAYAVIEAHARERGWLVSDALEDILRQVGGMPRTDAPLVRRPGVGVG